MPDESDVIINGAREISFTGCDDALQGASPKFTDSMLNKVQITVPID